MQLRFPGQYLDVESGLHYNWNRYYDPNIGRYITFDPQGIDIPGLDQSYAYANSNPLIFIDPLGLRPDCSYYTTHCREDGGRGENGGNYYCALAPFMCRWPGPDFPPPFFVAPLNLYWVECVRRCLQRRDPECDLSPGACSDQNVNYACTARIHGYCWTECAKCWKKCPECRGEMPQLRLLTERTVDRSGCSSIGCSNCWLFVDVCPLFC